MLNNYSETYAQARRRFLEAAEKNGAKIFNLTIPQLGPEQEVLSTDIAWLGAEKPKRLLLHSSGIHGPEGFAGSMIQQACLARLPKIPSDGALVFVHTLNPYGMAWLRRTNENNVDLNRNYLNSHEAWSGVSDTYRELETQINPATPPRMDAFYFHVLRNILQRGFHPLKAALATGQYEYPKGLFFGGKRHEAGTANYIQWLKNHVPEDSVERILAIDVHSGIGKFAKQSLFGQIQGGNSALKIMEKELGLPIHDNEHQITAAYPVRGGYHTFLPRLFPKIRVDFLTEEFGTYFAVRMLHALREENRLHHFGEARHLKHPVKQRIKKLFYPPSEPWRREVLRQGVDLFERAAQVLFRECV